MKIGYPINVFGKIIKKHCISSKDKSEYECNGIKVPRVTAVLSKTIHEDYLMNWANSLGFKHRSYRTVLNAAAHIGTVAHNTISHMILGDALPEVTIEESQSCINAFKAWWDMINSNNDIEVIGTETTLTCPYFGGTYDLLLKINGKVFLVDFKTSNRIGDKYFLQLAAYRYLIYYNTKIDLDGCLVLRLNKFDSSFEELVADLHNPSELAFINYCQETFFSLVTSYCYISDLNRRFNEFKKRKDDKK